MRNTNAACPAADFGPGNCAANDLTCAVPLRMATSIVGGCSFVDHLSGMAATSAVIFLTSAVLSPRAADSQSTPSTKCSRYVRFWAAGNQSRSQSHVRTGRRVWPARAAQPACVARISVRTFCSRFAWCTHRARQLARSERQWRVQVPSRSHARRRERSRARSPEPRKSCLDATAKT